MHQKVVDSVEDVRTRRVGARRLAGLSPGGWRAGGRGVWWWWWQLSREGGREGYG